MQIPDLVLASTSPRRKELLALGGEPFELLATHLNEEPRLAERPQEYVQRLANEKAEAAKQSLGEKDGLVLAADTTVVLDGKILGKPANVPEAREMLKSLRGRTHIVYTGLTLLRTSDGARLNDVAATQVPMRDYADEEIESYIASGDPLDKAGAYAIQHAGFHPVAGMDGCLANVVGLPLCHLKRSLEKWDLHFEQDLPAACQAHLTYDCPVTDKILNWEL